MQRGEWLVRLLECYRVAIRLLEQIQRESGFCYKRVHSVELADYKPTPTWFGGVIEIGYNNEPEAIAHELGHGLHEVIREQGWADCRGEEFADAIRYYAEIETGTDSPWLRAFDREKNTFTGRYTLPTFVNGLRDKTLFTETGWERNR